jgi:3-deoxy-manno-octulosonate cytidylyltransferase (CMP-KDO synthetase)
MMQTDVTCVVPARLGSTRFPRKLLRTLLDKPVVVHALERAAEAACFSEVVCFTDSIEIGEAVAQHGFRFVLTGEAGNGTERIGRNLEALKTELMVNLQGDEPAFPLEGLLHLCRGLRQHPEWVHTLVHEEAPTPSEMAHPHRVKAVLSAEGFILDFVRSVSEVSPEKNYRSHLGAYGYSKNYLRRYVATPASPREIEMSHELLRDLNRTPLRAHVSPPGCPVDVPADLAFALERLESLRTPQGVMP